MKEEQLWYWQVEENKLFMDLDEEIRLRVAKETFLETMPVVREPVAGQEGGTVPIAVSRQSPYSITVCVLALFVAFAHFFFSGSAAP